MNRSSTLIAAACLASALLLAACGGGGGAAAVAEPKAAPVIVTDPPPPAIFATAPFIDAAQKASCAGTRNQLSIIDNKMMFAALADTSCADAAYSQTLYGATPQDVLCSASDSILGPQIRCADPANRALFDTMRANLDKTDLGLGSDHKVQGVAFLLTDGGTLSKQDVLQDSLSGVRTARQIVIKDAAAWSSLWAEINITHTPMPVMPAIDFSKRMLLVVAAGAQANGCRELKIGTVRVEAKSIIAEFADRDISPIALCVPGATAPVVVVSVDRSEVPVVFLNTAVDPLGKNLLSFTELDHSAMSAISKAPETAVVRNAADFAALWARHSPGSAVPAVDFSKRMVLGVFLGAKPSGCYSTTIDRISLGPDTGGGKIVVHHNDTVPGIGALCTQVITAPAHLVVVDRSDAPVYFIADSVFLRAL